MKYLQCNLYHKDFFLIIWHCNCSALSVPDDGYSRNALCASKSDYLFIRQYLFGAHCYPD